MAFKTGSGRSFSSSFISDFSSFLGCFASI